MERQLFVNIRRLSGLNQYEMADKLGVSRSLVAKMEIGNRSVDPKIVTKVNQIYGAEYVTQVEDVMKAINK